MPELRFFIEGFAPLPHALASTLCMKLRVVNATPEPVHAVWLKCQLQIEPAKRAYAAAEAAGVAPLFGAPERWGDTLRPFLWQHAVAMVPGFTGTTIADVHLACTHDLTQAGARYFSALTAGEVPISAVFSGIALVQGERGVEACPIPWDLEASYRIPTALWRDAFGAA